MRRLPWLVIALAILVAAFSLEPIQDETYYWTWSRALHLAYVDHPPAIAWLLALSTHIFGSNLLGLRVPTLLSMVVVLALSIAGARKLAGPHASVHAALALLGAPMFVIGYLPATPDPLQGAMAACSAYFVIRALEPGSDPRWGAAAGFVLVASGLTKHSSALLALGALVALSLSREGRKPLLRATPWLGAALGLVVIAPWLWRDLSTLGSFSFQVDRVFTRGSFRGASALPIWLGGIMIALGPSTAIVLITSLRRASVAERALLGGALLLLLACVIPVWSGGGELNWSMPALAFACPALAARIARADVRWERAHRLFQIGSTGAMTLVLLHIAVPFLPMRAARDTTQRGAGFDRLSAKVEAIARAEGARTLITRRYQTASMLRYHLADRMPVLELGTSRRSQYDVEVRPRPQMNEVALLVLDEPSLPASFEAVEAYPVRELERTTAQGEVIDRWFVTLVRAARAVEGT